MRQRLFEHKLFLIQRQNSDPNALWKAGLNQFSDMSSSERSSYRGLVAGRRGSSGPSLVQVSPHQVTDVDEVTESWDWKHLESFQTVPDQGACGSCWAGSAAACLSGHLEIKTGMVKHFSYQHFVNCVSNPRECGGQGGCQGATPELAMEYIQTSLSLSQFPDLQEKPYHASNGICSSGSPAAVQSLRGADSQNFEAQSSLGVSLTGYKVLIVNDAQDLLKHLMIGPVVVSIAAASIHEYESGIFDGCSGASGREINHAVVGAGFGFDQVLDRHYWLIRNSWGMNWGEHGYIRILREPGNEKCGWDTNPASGVACKPYPEKQYFCGMCSILSDTTFPLIENIDL